ncbi:MAG TPA: tyrosine-protein phosphatase [Streptosporangiaceae bacterium]|nr:tyrosine-protein phosphatase [Streptosporangiaceae bacterium]
MAGRDLGFAELPNARDLGGYETADGRTVRTGTLLRADSLSRASRADVATLASMGVGLVIDLRGDTEIGTFGLGPWAGRRVHLPISDTAHDIVGLITQASPGTRLSEEEISGLMADTYREFVADDQARRQFATALEAIAARDRSPVLFHCTAGKDRTGWLAAIVLTALGVKQDDVYFDYLLTNERFTTGRGAAGRCRLLESLRALVGDVQPLMPVIEARPSYLAAAFAEADSRYGGFPAFLRQGLGVDAAVLRAKFLR